MDDKTQQRFYAFLKDLLRYRLMLTVLFAGILSINGGVLLLLIRIHAPGWSRLLGLGTLACCWTFAIARWRRSGVRRRGRKG